MSTDTSMDLAVQEQVEELKKRVEKLESKSNKLCMVVISGDFDKAMAAFIIANGALAMDKEVYMFFTFWGLDIIKKPAFSTKGQGILEKMVLFMRPKGPNNLPTSKMNFAGIGPRLFRFMMGRKNVEGLDPMIKMAQEFGGKIIACQMTMDLMGIQKDNLIDDIEVAGVAAFLSESYKSNTTLFI